MIYHLSQSVDGPLMNWTMRDWKKATKYITRPDGSRFSPVELKQAFLDELAQGHRVIPLAPCDNFDFVKGCLGHPDATKGED